MATGDRGIRLTAPDRVRRLLSIVPWVASVGGSSLDEIAERFDYPRDKLERDLVDVVGFVGVYPYSPDEMIEVFVDPDSGQVSISYDQFFNRPLQLTPEQALALVGAGSGLSSVIDDKDSPLATGLVKLADKLGVAPGETIDIQLGSGDPETLQAVREAVAGNAQIEIDYYSHSRDRRTRRVIDPQRLFAKDGAWYVGAFCHEAEGSRFFRVDRIHSAEPTGATFEPNDDIEDSLFAAAGGLPRVTIDVDEAGEWVGSYFPVDSVDSTGSGGARITLAVTAEAWLERLLLQLGPHATIVEVDDPYTADLAQTAAMRVLARYSSESVES